MSCISAVLNRSNTARENRSICPYERNGFNIKNRCSAHVLGHERIPYNIAITQGQILEFKTVTAATHSQWKMLNAYIIDIETGVVRRTL